MLEQLIISTQIILINIVNGKKNNSVIVSEGFKILDDGEQIFFTGKTKLRLINEKNK